MGTRLERVSTGSSSSPLADSFTTPLLTQPTRVPDTTRNQALSGLIASADKSVPAGTLAKTLALADEPLRMLAAERVVTVTGWSAGVKASSGDTAFSMLTSPYNTKTTP